MAHAEKEVVIAKTVSEVFNFLADGTNNPKWRPGVVSIELRTGQAGQLGAEYAQVLRGPGGRNITGDYKITTVVPNEKLSFAVISGPARPTGVFELEAQDNSTKVKFTLDYHTKGFAKLMEPMIQKTMNSEVAQLDSLKQVLES
jgi:uncharacterized membrane protein